MIVMAGFRRPSPRLVAPRSGGLRRGQIRHCCLMIGALPFWLATLRTAKCSTPKRYASAGKRKQTRQSKQLQTREPSLARDIAMPTQRFVTNTPLALKQLKSQRRGTPQSLTNS